MSHSRLDTVIALIDAANGADPNLVTIDGREVAAELAYGQRMSATLAQFAPDAGELLQIAVRAQHIERWKTPRGSFPDGRAGYHAWRRHQQRQHGERVSALMAEAGYDAADRARVAALVRKEGLKRDAETQILEDVACLVFLDHYAAEFAAPHDATRVIDILAKTMRKMSDRAIAWIARMSLDPALSSLVEAAKKTLALDDRQTGTPRDRT